MKKIFEFEKDGLRLISVNLKYQLGFKTIWRNDFSSSRKKCLVLSKDYRECKNDLTILFKILRKETAIHPVYIRYKFKTNKDCSNLLKIIDDSLQDACVIENDNLIYRAEYSLLERRKLRSRDYLKIEVYEF